MRKERDPDLIYIIIFWASLATIAAWMILKVTGIINTPVWQEFLPFAGMVFGMGAFFQMFVHMKDDLKGIKRKIGHMDGDTAHLRIDVEVLKSDVGTVKKKLRL